MLAKTWIDWSLVLAAIAILVSAFTWWRGHVTANRVAAIEIERRGEELASRKLADPVASFEKEISPPRSVCHRLVLGNQVKPLLTK